MLFFQSIWTYVHVLGFLVLGLTFWLVFFETKLTITRTFGSVGRVAKWWLVEMESLSSQLLHLHLVHYGGIALPCGLNSSISVDSIHWRFVWDPLIWMDISLEDETFMPFCEHWWWFAIARYLGVTGSSAITFLASIECFQLSLVHCSAQLLVFFNEIFSCSVRRLFLWSVCFNYMRSSDLIFDESTCI